VQLTRMIVPEGKVFAHLEFFKGARGRLPQHAFPADRFYVAELGTAVAGKALWQHACSQKGGTESSGPGLYMADASCKTRLRPDSGWSGVSSSCLRSGELKTQPGLRP